MLAASLLAPAVPAWIMAEKNSAMQVHWQILKTTAFLGIPTSRGFCAEGTCFFLSVAEEELRFTYVVTCSHVVSPFKSKRSLEPNLEKIWLRMNRKSGAPMIVETVRGHWIAHPNRFVDVCVYPFPMADWDADDGLDVSYMIAESIILVPGRYPEVGFSLGDEVFIVGAFVGRVGDKKNIPVVRMGNIAAMPEEPVWGGSPTRPAFLIETRSLGGVSGSPIFLHPFPQRKTGNWGLRIDEKGSVSAPYLLVGMMQGMHSGQYANDFVADDDAEKIVPTDTDFNAGIAIALPIDQIMEVLNRDDLKEARLETLRAKKKDSGYRPTSARPDISQNSSSASDANPDHLEDFTRLVDVAARKRPQGDQT
jgi:hypothetical protein